MPLYDYVCAACGEHATLLVGLGAAAPACPHCAAGALEKQLSVFAIGGRSGGATLSVGEETAAPAPRKTGCAAPGHVHGAGCRAGSAASGQGGPSCSPYADSVVKKYLPD
jgi:putative FmdB family regulatory protein